VWGIIRKTNRSESEEGKGYEIRGGKEDENKGRWRK
jgi:hypothetical protein